MVHCKGEKCAFFFFNLKPIMDFIFLREYLTKVSNPLSFF